MRRLLQNSLVAAAVLLAIAGCRKDPPADGPGPGHQPYIELTEYSASIGYQAQHVYFTVVADTDWTLSIEDEWITSTTTGAAAGTATEVTLDIDNNYTGKERVGGVFIMAGTATPVAFVVSQSTGQDPDYKFRISVSGVGGGKAGADKERAKAGETVSLTALPDPGYVFFQWKDATGSLNIVPSGEFTASFVMPQDNVSITAEFGTKDYDPPTDFTDQLTGANQGVYELMRDWYYWNDAVRTAVSVPRNNLSSSDFLQQLIEGLRWDKVQDVSNGESPPTIDGQWNDARTARDHVYSYIQQSLRTRAGRNESTFGLGFIPLGLEFDPNISDGSEIRYFLISWIVPGGPADNAGLKRGTVIAKYNDINIRYNQYSQFFNQLYNGQGTTMKLTDVTGREYSLSRTTMNVSPTIAKKMLTSGSGKKVAYLAYTDFESGGGSGRFDSELRTTFGNEFAGADELVLDLRYNGGGMVSSCQVLASLIGNVSSSMIFGKLLYNPHTASVAELDNPELLPFRDEPNSLQLRKVYVLGTKNTASASEMIISSLMGADIEVVLIGEETNGKNVGMDGLLLQEGNYYYEFRPITFKILNAKDFCDYAGGFQPDYRINELRGLSPTDGSGIRELGDPQEELLKAALTHIDGGTPAVDQTTRSAFGGGVSFTGQLYPPEKGLVGNTYELRDGKWQRTTMQ